MTKQLPADNTQYEKPQFIKSLEGVAALADYSLLSQLNCDPDATEDGIDYAPRQVFSGHYVPVAPTPLANPEYITHSQQFFSELGFADELAHTSGFKQMFSGDLSNTAAGIGKLGWATGYALSIFGTEYTQQCPFQTGNGYGDGRAISVLELLVNGQRWEMQLKGAGQTPYCRGGDGRAVLRSSIREFLAQEYMHALAIPTSRSLSLFVSKTQTVKRPWYSEGSRAVNPDRMVAEPVAISTRVAPSFIRVGQLELFGRRARDNAHPNAQAELATFVQHLIDREYSAEIDSALSLCEKTVLLANAFRQRLIALVVNWMRVGYCQGNFNSDNCAAGGYTLDYGPFGFCEVFNPQYQPWAGGGAHYAFYNQSVAAQYNFQMFCRALKPLLVDQPVAVQQLDQLVADFSGVFAQQQQQMWADKLGLAEFDQGLFETLEQLMLETAVDYTMFFRELSYLPNDIQPLQKSFYQSEAYLANKESIDQRWRLWLQAWHVSTSEHSTTESKALLAQRMQQINPKYCLREWLVVPAYQQAAKGNYQPVRELQAVMREPYAEQSKAIEQKYYCLKPAQYFGLGGVSHYSCSS